MGTGYGRRSRDARCFAHRRPGVLLPHSRRRRPAPAGLRRRARRPGPARLGHVEHRRPHPRARLHLASPRCRPAWPTTPARPAGSRTRELADTWPNLEWWLAVNPGLPIEGYLPAWFVAQLSRGDLRLPTRGPGREARQSTEPHAGSARGRGDGGQRGRPGRMPAPASGGPCAGAPPAGLCPACHARRRRPRLPASGGSAADFRRPDGRRCAGLPSDSTRKVRHAQPSRSGPGHAQPGQRGLRADAAGGPAGSGPPPVKRARGFRAGTPPAGRWVRVACRCVRRVRCCPAGCRRACPRPRRARVDQPGGIPGGRSRLRHPVRGPGERARRSVASVRRPCRAASRFRGSRAVRRSTPAVPRRVPRPVASAQGGSAAAVPAAYRPPTRSPERFRERWRPVRFAEPEGSRRPGRPIRSPVRAPRPVARAPSTPWEAVRARLRSGVRRPAPRPRRPFGSPILRSPHGRRWPRRPRCPPTSRRPSRPQLSSRRRPRPARNRRRRARRAHMPGRMPRTRMSLTRADCPAGRSRRRPTGRPRWPRPPRPSPALAAPRPPSRRCPRRSRPGSRRSRASPRRSSPVPAAPAAVSSGPAAPAPAARPPIAPHSQPPATAGPEPAGADPAARTSLARAGRPARGARDRERST